MALKRNAQKILLLLWDVADHMPVRVDMVRLVVPNMTETGYRSLISFLEKRGLLYREKWLEGYSIGLTKQGRIALTATFPALLDRWVEWDGQWMLLVCTVAPKSDPSFRDLRSRLLQENALVLSRGVYAIPHSFSRGLLDECAELYSKSVAVFSVDRAHQGLDRPLIVSYYDLEQIAHIYSGISKEISTLLLKNKSKNTSIDQHKKIFAQLFDQYIECLRGDIGILRHYFPGVPDAISLVSQLKKVIEL